MKEKLDILYKRIKANFNNNRTTIILLLFFWIIVATVSVFLYKGSLGRQSYGNSLYDQNVKLDKNTIIREVVSVEDKTESIAIKFATYARKNKGKVFVVVEGFNSKEKYSDVSFDVTFIEDNAFRIIALNEAIEQNKDNRIVVTVKSNSEKNECVGVYYSNTKVLDDSQLMINNRLIDGDMTLRMLLKDNDLATFSNVVVGVTILFFSILVLILLLINPKYEVFFAVTVILIGSLFSISITPMSAPDEQAHYEYAFQLSNKMLFEKDYTYFDSEYQNYGSFAGHLNVSSAYKRIVQKINRPLSLNNEKIKIENEIDEGYSLHFLPQAIGITIARIFKLNMLKTFYLGRFTNLLFYSLCVFVAIRKTPIHKILFGVLASLPMVLQQASSYSYDSFVNGLTFVVIAYLLSFIFDEKGIANKEIVFITIVCAILSPSKVVYSFYSFLFWLVPEKKYGNRKRKVICTLILNLSAVIQLLGIIIPVIERIVRNVKELMSVSNTVLLLEQENNTWSDFAPLGLYTPNRITVGDVIRYPSVVFMMILRTIRYNIKLWYYGSLGRVLSGVSLLVPIRIIQLLAITTVLAGLRKEDKIESPLIKTVFILVCVIIGLFTIGGMLLSWTSFDQIVIEDYGGMIVEGIQGRYFCPLLPFAYTVLNNKYIRVPVKFDKYIIYAELILVFETILYVLSYTFVN